MSVVFDTIYRFPCPHCNEILIFTQQQHVDDSLGGASMRHGEDEEMVFPTEVSDG